MSAMTAQSSFHHFSREVSTELWDKWVKLPIVDELKDVDRVFRKRGYLGGNRFDQLH